MKLSMLMWWIMARNSSFRPTVTHYTVSREHMTLICRCYQWTLRVIEPGWIMINTYCPVTKIALNRKNEYSSYTVLSSENRTKKKGNAIDCQQLYDKSCIRLSTQLWLQNNHRYIAPSTWVAHWNCYHLCELAIFARSTMCVIEWFPFLLISYLYSFFRRAKYRLIPWSVYTSMRSGNGCICLLMRSMVVYCFFFL